MKLSRGDIFTYVNHIGTTILCEFVSVKLDPSESFWIQDNPTKIHKERYQHLVDFDLEDVSNYNGGILSKLDNFKQLTFTVKDNKLNRTIYKDFEKVYDNLRINIE